MSTRFTKGGVPLADSETLKLIQSASNLNEEIAKFLSVKLVEMGYTLITPSLLSFLSILECGVNYGSEIARNLGVTRQMVAKNVKELCRLGYLKQVDGSGKQKQILFTEKGEFLMSDARQILADLDVFLSDTIGGNKLSSIIAELNKLSGMLKK